MEDRQFLSPLIDTALSKATIILSLTSLNSIQCPTAQRLHAVHQDPVHKDFLLRCLCYKSLVLHLFLPLRPLFCKFSAFPCFQSSILGPHCRFILILDQCHQLLRRHGHLYLVCLQFKSFTSWPICILPTGYLILLSGLSKSACPKHFSTYHKLYFLLFLYPIPGQVYYVLLVPIPKLESEQYLTFSSRCL